MSSIIPVGRNKSQVHQGGFKHESILNDNSLFNSLAYKKSLDVGNLKQSPEEEVPNVPKDLQNAVNQGSLDPEQGMPKEPDMGAPEEVGGGAELDVGGAPGNAPNGNRVTDQGEQVTRTVQEALGLDPEQGWLGSTKFDSALGGGLSGITIQLKKQTPEAGPAVQKGGPPYGGGTLPNGAPKQVTESV